MYSKIRRFNTNIHIMTINPTKCEIVLVATDGNTLLPVTKLENHWLINNGYKRVGAINGGFFQGSGMANGWEFVDYDYLYTEGYKDGILDLFYKDMKLIIDDVDMDKFNNEYRGKAQWGVSASYSLVQNGVKDLTGSSKFSHSNSYNPRTFIGQKANGDILFMVCDGRGKADSTGLTASQQADVCLELGCVTAINLDGGGSSTLEYMGSIKNTPTDGSLRKVSNAIVVYSKDVNIGDGDSKPDGGNNMIKLCLDAGHGYNTSGKRTPDDIREWYMNDRVCNFITEKLKAYKNIEVYRTDDTTGVTDIPLSDRVAKCNEINPDLFISIHHNATGSDWVDNVTGTEVYWHTLGTKEDEKVAHIMAPKIAGHTGLKNRGVKQERFAVLGCKSTAILCEGGFMNSRIDHPVITTWGQEGYANAIVEGLIEYFGLVKEEVTTPPVEAPEEKPTTNIAIGDKVRVNDDAYKYATVDKLIPSYVKGNVYTVSKVDSEKVLLQEITSWVFIKDVTKVGGDLTTPQPEQETFKVRIICDSLNIRKSDSFDSPIVGEVKKGDVYTIVKMSNNLGLLKSNVGWISMGSAYVEKL